MIKNKRGVANDTLTTPFLIKNTQSAIITLLDNSGSVIVKYNYDAWGNHTVTDVNGNDVSSDATHIANLNPFRYRGYYYDTETKLYYLKTRYYDAEIGRFITIDSIEYLDPDTINGLNLYAYCGNNPIANIDPNGNLFISLLLLSIGIGAAVGGIIFQATVSILSYATMSVWALGDLIFNNGEGAWADMCNIKWNPFNIDENKVMESKHISFYKGVPVFRSNIDRSGSFGAIFLSRGYYDKSGLFHPLNNPDTLKHERGHNWQLMMMGIVNYGIMIGLPSWLKWSDKPYYDSLWEITADILGGVSRTHTQADINRGWWYLIISALLGPIAYFFLLGEH